MSNEALKIKAASLACDYIEDNMIVGVGTGSTVEYFIAELSKHAHRIDGFVSSSQRTTNLLRSIKAPILDLNTCKPDIYVDGADEFNALHQLIKGGGGAHTKEKITAASSNKFICIVDETKKCEKFRHPVAVEVIPMARGLVARSLLELGANPVLREGFVTDSNNIIIDAHDLDISDASILEKEINNIPGVVDNGIFARTLADTILLATSSGVKTLSR